jgi:hypothetical protein
MFNCFFSCSSYFIYSGIEKAPADPAAREALWVNRSSEVQSNKICCLSFQIGFRYSEPKQYSRSPLRDLGVNALIIIKELRIWCREGPSTGYLRQYSQRIHSVSVIKNCFVCLGTKVKRTPSLEDKSWQETIRLPLNCLSLVSDFNQIRDASKILGTNSDMKFWKNLRNGSRSPCGGAAKYEEANPPYSELF